MRRRAFIALLGGAAAAWPLAARAQQPDRMRRIGVLLALAASDPEGQARIASFKRELAKLGWTEGRNIRIDDRWPGADVGQIERTAAELVALAPDVIFINSQPAFDAMRQATRTIPVVFVQVTDPVASGLLPSLARPGGNLTGLSNYETAFARRSAGGLIVLASPTTNLHRELIIALAARHRLPAVYPYRYFVVSGGLASYGVDNIDLYRRAAGYVDRILRGEKPGDLPIQQPTRLELVVNLKTAKAMGLAIPESFLLRADEVIE